MCQQCEDGIPDPTPRELRAELGRIVDDAEGLIAKLAETTASRTAIAEVVEYIFWQSYERAERRLIVTLAIYRATLAAHDERNEQ